MTRQGSDVMEKSFKSVSVAYPVRTRLGPLFVNVKACEPVAVSTVVRPQLWFLGETTQKRAGTKCNGGQGQWGKR
jgi:hypothetical protein